MEGTLYTRSSALFASLSAIAGVALAIGAAPAHAGSSTLTLEASRTELEPNQTVDLSGTLAGTFGSPSGKTVTLLASAYPYGSESVAGTTTTGNGGAYSFPDTSPAYNTRYRVSYDGGALDGDAMSSQVQIYRFIKDKYQQEVTSDGYVEGRLDLLYPAGVQPEYYIGRKDVFWFFAKAKQNRFKRVERSSFFDTPTGVAADVRFRLPRSRKAYRFFFFPCVEAPAADIGIGNEVSFKCPKSVPARDASGFSAPLTSGKARAPHAARQ